MKLRSLAAALAATAAVVAYSGSASAAADVFAFENANPIPPGIIDPPPPWLQDWFTFAPADPDGPPKPPIPKAPRGFAEMANIYGVEGPDAGGTGGGGGIDSKCTYGVSCTGGPNTPPTCTASITCSAKVGYDVKLWEPPSTWPKGWATLNPADPDEPRTPHTPYVPQDFAEMANIYGAEGRGPGVKHPRPRGG